MEAVIFRYLDVGFRPSASRICCVLPCGLDGDRNVNVIKLRELMKNMYDIGLIDIGGDDATIDPKDYVCIMSRNDIVKFLSNNPRPINVPDSNTFVLRFLMRLENVVVPKPKMDLSDTVNFIASFFDEGSMQESKERVFTSLRKLKKLGLLEIEIPFGNTSLNIPKCKRYIEEHSIDIDHCGVVYSSILELYQRDVKRATADIDREIESLKERRKEALTKIDKRFGLY